MKQADKKKVRADFALKRINEPVILDSKLLRKQINTLSNLTRTVNESIGDDLIAAIQVLEVFEWLPKGEYDIKIIIM